MPTFYCFNNLTHVIQPKRSSWCWAACLEKMIIGLQSRSEIGTKSCELVSFYSAYKKGIAPTGKYCCNSECSCNNIGIKPEHVEFVFDKAGFTTKKIKPLLTYEKIVEKLTSNQSPLVINTNIDKPHMELIIGFGSFDNCKYLLISDPSKYSDIHYTRMAECGINRQISMWETKLKNNTKNLVTNIHKTKIINYNYSVSRIP